MTNTPLSYRILCNGAKARGRPRKNQKQIELEWREEQSNPRNMSLGLPRFVGHVFHLPDRLLDLLEIAAYVFCADRRCSRGKRDQLEFHNWSRCFDFHIKVRDDEFWSDPVTKNALQEALLWMTGDQDYSFTFYPGHQTPPADLFDHEGQKLDISGSVRVLLFSGGLDSLAGAAESLEKTQDKICLVSHRSQPGTVRTQKVLFEALKRKYPNRVIPYPFSCTLSGVTAEEESQRTRAFLYCSIALAVCGALSKQEFYVYENGVTALNFPKRRDMFNARASRTAHPKTLAFLRKLFALVEDKPINIRVPFMFKTKADVFETLHSSANLDLVNSSISCSRTFQNLGGATHCGRCSQCVDRRFAAYASGCEQQDEGGIYAFDFIQDQVEDGETKTTLVDFLRQAKNFAEWNVDCFCREMLDPLCQVAHFIPGMNDQEAQEEVYALCHRHGLHVRNAIKRMYELLHDPYHQFPPDSLFRLIDRGEHLRPPVELLIQRICEDLGHALPIAFRKNKPKDENDLNDKVEAYLSQNEEKFEREHPVIKFGLTSTIPDHSVNSYDLLIEVKYLRGGTTAAKASKGIAEDLTKYPEESFKLFLVYDPERSIKDDQEFATDFESKDACRIYVIR